MKAINMKITRLVNYLKQIKYCHDPWKNVDIDICHKVYESYMEKCKSMSKNRFCEYLKHLWFPRSTVMSIIDIWSKLKDPHQIKYWEDYRKNNYLNRFKITTQRVIDKDGNIIEEKIVSSKTKKVDTLTDEQLWFVTTDIPRPHLNLFSQTKQDSIFFIVFC